MFAIDLLKGQGLPQKTGMLRRILRAAGLALPLAALVLLAGAWQYDRAKLNAEKSAIVKNEAMVRQNWDQVEAYRQTSAQISRLNKQLAQVAGALNCRIQVTDLLNELLERLPEEIFFYEITLDRTSSKQKYQSEGSKEAKQRTVIRRSLTLVLCDFNTPGGDRLVQDYVAELKKSKLAGSLFKEIKTAARQQGAVDGRDATYYSIECELQEQTH
ncbi:MAG: hypothetical protein LLF76_05180 [Planctomycetaceae bacterium]|nr:hypothetical protein [Planctomycetaceae bacterium]